ncbi:desaturase [Chromatiales bacterium (ex Bugula neritina AB1)]|nr:desaturase [Chromatiales bacterium (ex Bugula neritina AB1)]
MSSIPDNQVTSGQRKSIWNHQTPVVFAALFDWPPRPGAAFLSVTKRWFSISRNLLFLLLAVLSYHLLTPELSSMKSLSLEWIGPIVVRNAVLMLTLAGGLHLYLFRYKKQGKKLKYDPREELEKGGKFSFRNQVHDNMFWSLSSGVAVWSLYEILYFHGVANGVIPTIAFTDHPLAFLLWLVLLPFILSTHFYLTHRLLHWPPLFQIAHKLHHRNTHIGPWSGMSMHPIEHILYISSVLLHFVIPSHPILVIMHLYTRCLAPALSHAGFEQILVKDKKLIDAADFHHQLHHRFFECNYGNPDSPWDRWFGSLHDGSDAATAMVRERRRRMYQSRHG